MNTCAKTSVPILVPFRIQLSHVRSSLSAEPSSSSPTSHVPSSFWKWLPFCRSCLAPRPYLTFPKKSSNQTWIFIPNHVTHPYFKPM